MQFVRARCVEGEKVGSEICRKRTIGMPADLHRRRLRRERCEVNQHAIDSVERCSAHEPNEELIHGRIVRAAMNKARTMRALFIEKEGCCAVSFGVAA